MGQAIDGIECELPTFTATPPMPMPLPVLLMPATGPWIGWDDGAPVMMDHSADPHVLLKPQGHSASLISSPAIGRARSRERLDPCTGLSRHRQPAFPRQEPVDSINKCVLDEVCKLSVSLLDRCSG